jgi:hypothetical protein
MRTLDVKLRTNLSKPGHEMLRAGTEGYIVGFVSDQFGTPYAIVVFNDFLFDVPITELQIID